MPLEIRRQLRAEPLPKNAHHHVAAGGIGDLVLKGPVGGVVIGLPAQHVDLDRTGKGGVEAAGDAVDTFAFRHHVGGRRHENADGGLFTSPGHSGFLAMEPARRHRGRRLTLSFPATLGINWRHGRHRRVAGLC
jgi:hypothetical protein